jgi:hypothetical protein
MSMLNNTKVRVTYRLEEIIQIAFKELAVRNLVPHTAANQKPIEYQARHRVENGEGKLVTNIGECTVTFGLTPIEKTSEKPYQAGDWKDPEVDKIINEN